MKSSMSRQPDPASEYSDDPPILYLRSAILVRDPARASAEVSPTARELSLTLRLIGAAAIIGSLLGLLLR